MLNKIRKILCKLGFHKWEKLPKEKYFKMELKDGKLILHKGSMIVDNVVPEVFKCKYCNKTLVKSSLGDKGKIIEWWGGIKDVEED